MLADEFRVLDAPGPRLLLLLRHPVRVGRVLRILRAKPVLEARLSRTPEGEATRTGLLRNSRLSRFLVGGATAVLVLPADPDAYERGNARATLRNKRRSAERQGVTWRRISSATERAALLAHANRFEQDGEPGGYRTSRPRNADMLGIERWYAAYSEDGEPLVLAVVSRDGLWADLRYYRTLQSSRDASASRFLLMSAIARELGAEGVRYVATPASPLSTPEGLRVYQYIVGFDLYRVRLVRRPKGP